MTSRHSRIVNSINKGYLVKFRISQHNLLRFLAIHVQSNHDSSNTDGSCTMANSNSFMSPYEVLPIAQENKYLGKCSYFIVKLYVVCTH